MLEDRVNIDKSLVCIAFNVEYREGCSGSFLIIELKVEEREFALLLSKVSMLCARRISVIETSLPLRLKTKRKTLC